jgi:hypothetical protein
MLACATWLSPAPSFRTIDFRRGKMAKRNAQTAARDHAQLDSRLGHYSANARTSTASKALLGRIGNWPIYAAAAGSALAMATSASASIIAGVYNPTSNTVIPNTPGNIGFLGIGTDHVVIKAVSGVTAKGPTAILSVIGFSPVGIFETATYSQNARKFAPGAPISTGPFAATGKIVKAHFSGKDFGEFTAGIPGYAGLVINAGTHLDYGWLKLEFTDDPVTGLPATLTAIAYGIQTDGGHIDAGETPEPDTMALALLASGATGVAALRRRRMLKQTPR